MTTKVYDFSRFAGIRFSLEDLERHECGFCMGEFIGSCSLSFEIGKVLIFPVCPCCFEREAIKDLVEFAQDFNPDVTCSAIESCITMHRTTGEYFRS